MATLFELKERLERGGKIRRPSWGKGAYVKLALVDEQEGYFYDKQVFLDDWEVYEEPKKQFEITHTGLYKTRDGRMALVSFIRNSDHGVFGVIDGENYSRCWDRSGENCAGEENPEDIVSEWED